METEVLSGVSVQLGVTSQPIIRKAEELMRLVDVQSASISSLNISGSCKAVICLEMAAQMCGEHVDRDTAIRVSGTAKKLYINALKMMECALDLNTKMTIADLAITFGCTEAKTLALKVLSSFERAQKGRDSADLDKPLFRAAAVFVASKKLKVKIDKKKLVELTGARKVTFDKLVLQMEAAAENLDLSSKSAGKRSTDVNYTTSIEERANSHEHRRGHSRDILHTEESFADWKFRILTNAYKEIGEVYIPKACSS